MSEKPEEKNIVLFRGEAQHALARFAEAEVVRALATRIMATDNRKEPLTPQEAYLTAQSALAYRLDPFMGELWSWVSIKQGRRVLTIMRGRDGVLKIAKKNMKANDTYILREEYRVIDNEAERTALRVPEKALAIECRVEDYKANQEWRKAYSDLSANKVAHPDIIDLIGRPPADQGLGILTDEEIENLEWAHDRNGKRVFKLEVKMTHVERCQKRALTAALRKRWAAAEDVEALDASLDTEDYIIDGEWVELSKQQADIEADRAPCPACQKPIARSLDKCPECGVEGILNARKAKVEKDKETLWGKPPQQSKPEAEAETEEPETEAVQEATQEAAEDEEPRRIEPDHRTTLWPPEFYRIVRDGFIMPEDAVERHCEGLFNLSPFKPTDPPAWMKDWGTLYRNARDAQKAAGDEKAKGASRRAADQATRTWANFNSLRPEVKARFPAEFFKS
jgi:hypothetical protein